MYVLQEQKEWTKEREWIHVEPGGKLKIRGQQSAACCCILKGKLYQNTATLLIYILSVAAFMIQQQSWLVVMETLWPTKPKTFTIWPYKEKACRLPTVRILTKKQTIKYSANMGEVSKIGILKTIWDSMRCKYSMLLKKKGGTLKLNDT